MLLNKSKLPATGSTIFTEMSQLALKHNAINLGQGFPDFPMDDALIEVNGAIAVTVPLSFPEYKIDWNEVRKKINEKTKVIIINSPQNPTGAVLSADDMQQLINITRDTNILILSDEVYEHLIYDNEIHQSVLRYPELKARSFACFSFGKVFNCTGWKLGYCVAPDELMKEFRKVHQYNCFSCFTPAQVAIAAYLQNKTAYLSLSETMQGKRDYFRELMRDTLFRPLHSKGSYFECYDYSSLSDANEKTFATELTCKAGVTGIPVSAFYRSAVNNKVIRFCFSKKSETLENAAERLISFAGKLSSS